MVGNIESYKPIEVDPKDPELQKGLNKILENGLSNSLIQNLYDIEELKKLNPKNYITKFLSKNPQLLMFVNRENLNKIKSDNFNNLNINEKMKFISFQKTISDGLLKNPIKSNSFAQIYQNNYKNIISNLNIDFNLDKLSNLNDLNKTLQGYGCTQNEIKKIEHYLNYLRENPNISIKETNEAGAGGYLIFLGIGIILGGLGYHVRENYINKPETTFETGRIEFSPPEEIMQLLTLKSKFKTQGSIEEKYFDESVDDGTIINTIKKGVNLFQSVEIKMEMKGEIAVNFNLDGGKFEYDYSDKKIYATFRNPEMMIINSETNVVYKDGEFFETKKFNNSQSKLIKNLKEKVKKNASEKKELINRAKTNTENILTAIYEQAFELSGEKFNGVEVKILEQDSINRKKNNIEKP